MAYGAGRSWLSGMLAPVTSKIPAGNYADELAMGTIGWFAAKKGRGMVKQIGMAMLTVEAASVGNQLAAGMSNGNKAQYTGAYYV